AVRTALDILTAEWGYAVSPRRITVSTVGLVPAIPRLIADTRVNLAMSLSATTDAQRARLMPVDRRYPLRTLLDACRALPLPRRQRITFEYVMLGGENDSEADARRLVRLLHGLRAKVNLIPFNPFPGGASSRARGSGSCASRRSCATTACTRPSARAGGRTSRPPAGSSPRRAPRPDRLACPASASSSIRTPGRTASAARSARGGWPRSWAGTAPCA